jgi:hypothetical protein
MELLARNIFHGGDRHGALFARRRADITYAGTAPYTAR